MATKWTALFCLVALVVGLVIGHFAWSHPAAGRSETLVIYHAGSLSVPFELLADEFERTHPTVDVLCESAGSAATIRKVTELGKTCDIIGSADYTLIPNMMYPDYADWYIAFARNEIVLGYRNGAPFADEIASGNRTWYDVLLNEDVSYGHSNPDLDPCGYRALMVCQLAQYYYYDQAGINFTNTPDPDADGLYNALIHGSGMEQGRYSIDREVVRPKEVDLLALIEAGELDYMLQYKSVCVQHDIDYIELAPQTSLSQTGEIPDSTIGQRYEGEDGFYWEAMVVIVGSSPGTEQEIHGKPIVYGITIPKNAPNPERAAEFVNLLLSEKGRQIMTDICGQPSVYPAQCDNPENLPIWVEAAP